MTREEVLQIAREHIHDTWNSADWFSASPDALFRFANAIAAREREACAVKAARMVNGKSIAAAIRMKGTK